jgi:hypothetical protein
MAVQSRAALKADKNTAFADNTAGDISAADLRGEFEDVIDSVYIPGDDNSGDTQLMTAAEKSKLANAIENVVEDTTPQLGGNLDVNGNSIVSASNGNITIAPNGTGNIVLGNYTIDADATVGASQDNFVLKYDHASGLWRPEADSGASGGDAWSDPVDSNITFDSDGTRDIGTNTVRAGHIYTDNLTVTNAVSVASYTGLLGLTGGTSIDVNTRALLEARLSDVTELVETTDTQTLTNKTLTAPVITSPEVSYTSDNDGTQSSGTYTPAVSGSNIKRIVNGGAFTLGVPSGEGTFAVQVTNNSSAGAITTSGFTAVKGDTLTTTDGDDFMLFITVVNSFSVLNVVALQ